MIYEGICHGLFNACLRFNLGTSGKSHNFYHGTSITILTVAQLYHHFKQYICDFHGSGSPEYLMTMSNYFIKYIINASWKMTSGYNWVARKMHNKA